MEDAIERSRALDHALEHLDPLGEAAQVFRFSKRTRHYIRWLVVISTVLVVLVGLVGWIGWTAHTAARQARQVQHEQYAMCVSQNTRLAAIRSQYLHQIQTESLPSKQKAEATLFINRTYASNHCVKS